MHRHTDRSVTFASVRRLLRLALLLILEVSIGSASGWGQTPAPAWRGILQDEAAHHIVQAKVELDAGDDHKAATTISDGSFVFPSLLSNTYSLCVEVSGRVYRSTAAIKIPAQAAEVMLTLKDDGTLIVGNQ
jgi:hypothetical protein